MSKRLKQRAAITQVLCGHLLENGLQQTSLRQLAKAAGVSDRMLLYYFEDKADVLAEVMQAIASRFTQHLDMALPTGEVRSMAEVFEEVTLLSAQPDVQPFMNIWIETIAAAARGTEPYKSAAIEIASGFLTWIEARLAPGPEAPEKAAAVLTLIEGLAVMGACADEQVQASAAAKIKLLIAAQPA